VKHRFLAVALACVCASLPVAARAWGSTGHTLINRLAASALPGTLPAFVRRPQAVAEIAALGPEEDRLKGAGSSWDEDNDPGHYIDVGDDVTVDGVVALRALPKDMESYDRALEPVRSDAYRAGFLPYSIMDGFERVRKDFALWRVDAFLAAHAATPAMRAAFSRDRALREDLTLRDIGDWGHFVGDGSQPLHVTVHFNGWGDGPNPNHYTHDHIHSFFESTFVNRYARIGAVRAAMAPYRADVPAHLLSQTQIGTIVGRYLIGTAQAVDPLYALYALGDFQHGSPKAVAFTDAQLARGASELRDLIALAWNDSLNASVGYPEVLVRDILSGKVVPRRGD
jgi:hypothetical protein